MELVGEFFHPFSMSVQINLHYHEEEFIPLIGFRFGLFVCIILRYRAAVGLGPQDKLLKNISSVS
jgi:hypothetical protein